MRKSELRHIPLSTPPDHRLRNELLVLTVLAVVVFGIGAALAWSP